MSTGDGRSSREPNRLLAHARRAHQLTQYQLAEAVGAAHWRLFGRQAAVDADHVSKLERGVITWPNARYREAFRTVLDAACDADLGFYHRRARATVETGDVTRGGQEVDTVRRVEFIRLLTGIGAGTGLSMAGVGAALSDPTREMMSRAATPTVPGRVGNTDVEQVRYAAATFRSWREQFGGAACREALAEQLRWAAGLLRARSEGENHRNLHSAVGSLADVAGWGDMDSGHHDTARGCFRLALHCADVAQDWDLRAEVITDMARQAMDTGQLDEALSLIELAQVRADRVSGTGRAMMSSEHARIFGISGRTGECRRAVSSAEDHFANRRPGGQGSPYFQQTSQANLVLDNGQALFYPGVDEPGAASVARDHLRTALGHGSTLGRRRSAIGTAKLATLELLHGDRDDGITLGHRALALGDGVRSARFTDDLRRLRHATVRHSGEPVETLQRQLHSTLASA